MSIKRLFIEVPGDCEGRCGSCFSSSGASVDLTPLEGILEDSMKVGFNWFGFCGTDPLQNNLPPGLLEWLSSNPVRVRVYTALLSNDTEVHRCKVNFSRVDITLIVWGPPQVHDQISGVPGAFWRAYRRLQEWKEAGANTAVKFFPRDSYHDTATMRNIFRQLDLPLIISLWWAPFYRTEREEQDGLLSPENALSIARKEEMKYQRSYIENNPPCKAGWKRAFIAKDLTLRPCHTSANCVADLKHEKFSDVWKDDSRWGAWRTLKFKDLGECVRCRYSMTCHICPVEYIEKGEKICSSWKAVWAKNNQQMLQNS